MTRSPYLQDARAQLFAGMGTPAPSEFVSDEFQREAILSVTEGNDTLVVAPTGSGKTYIALEAVRSALEQQARAVYTTPLKALSNTKYAELKRRFEPQYRVGLLTGDRKIEGDADVVVATTEIYRNELYRTKETYSLVVLDEVHFIADPQRGPVWEESIILTPRSSALLMLSASISNAEEIRDWLEEVRGKTCRIITKKERPVQLRYGFLHPDYGILPLTDAKGHLFREVQNFYNSSSFENSGRQGHRRGSHDHDHRRDSRSNRNKQQRRRPR